MPAADDVVEQICGAVALDVYLIYVGIDLTGLMSTSMAVVTFPFSHGQKLVRICEQLLAPAPGKREAIVFDYDDVNVAPLHRAHEKRVAVLEQLQKQTEQAYQSWAQLRLDL